MGKDYTPVCGDPNCDGRVSDANRNSTKTNYRCRKCGKLWTKDKVMWIMNPRVW